MKQKQYELNNKQRAQLTNIKCKHPDARIQMKYTNTTGIGTNVEVVATEKVKGVVNNYIYDITDYDSW